MVDMASFTTLVFSTTGGMGKAATFFYKRLTGLLAERTVMAYSTTMAWIRARLNYALLRSGLLCLRGWRPRQRGTQQSLGQDSMELAACEARIED